MLRNDPNAGTLRCDCMTLFQIISLGLMAAFYGVYLTKQASQRRHGIRTNQMGRGMKSKGTLTVERLLSVFSVLIVMVEVWSIVRGYSFLPQWCGWIGLTLTAFGVIFFISAVVQMRDSWRAGISPDEKTGLVTSGIYSVSRNPAFVGFDLTYIGLLLCFANRLHLVVVVCTVVIFHLQILQEEQFLLSRTDIDYKEYYNRVRRYL